MFLGELIFVFCVMTFVATKNVWGINFVVISASTVALLSHPALETNALHPEPASTTIFTDLFAAQACLERNDRFQHCMSDFRHFCCFRGLPSTENPKPVFFVFVCRM